MEVFCFFRTVSIQDCYEPVCKNTIPMLLGLKMRSLNRGGTGLGMEQECNYTFAC